MEGLLSTREAARRIGVSERQVRHLVRSHLLASVAKNAITETSVTRYKLNRDGATRRAWSEATAWQAIAVVARVDVTTIGQSQRSRVRAALRAMSAEQFVIAVRNRAHTFRCVGHRRSAARIARELVSIDRGSRTLGLTAAPSAVDGYAAAAVVEELISKYHLRLDMDANDAALLRAVSHVDIGIVQTVNVRSEILIALSLAESLDTRERAAGLAFLASALKGVELAY